MQPVIWACRVLPAHCAQIWTEDFDGALCWLLHRRAPLFSLGRWEALLRALWLSQTPGRLDLALHSPFLHSADSNKLRKRKNVAAGSRGTLPVHEYCRK